MRLLHLVFAPLVTTLLLVSCASSSRTYSHDAPLLPGMSSENSEPDDDDDDEIPADLAPAPTPPLNPNPSEPDDEEADIDFEKAKKPQRRQIPFEFNQKVAEWIRYFSQNDRERFQRFLDRGEPYREVVQNILEENQVPTDLYYLGLIESGFHAKALSRVKAVGVWQFMRATGKMYGLGVDSYEDQRIDPIRATEAAAKMLRDLYREFKDWYLAMAAYNAGPGRIRGVIRRAKTNDFWELVERKKLPRETMEYVPKFLAARYIAENPELFAFYINEERKFPDVELVKVPSPIRFSTIEKICSIPEGTLSFVNPHYLRPYTHPARARDEIWVPENYLKKVESQLTLLASHREHVRPSAAAGRGTPRKASVAFYRVKRGDTLKSIARRQGLSVAYLKRVNGLRGSRLAIGQRLKLSASSYHQKRTHPRKHKKKRSRK